ncbi:MAG: DUF4198 domain-containing protein [Rubrivivax sp.]|nr:DUF4198 domain-containing protein [Rubrivivax sp.]
MHRFELLFARLARPIAALLVGLVALAPARAHDTWFAAQPGAGAGAWQLALGTGDRFPDQQFTLSAELLQRQGCRQGDGQAQAMRVLRQRDQALQLQPRSALRTQRGQHGAQTCWAQLRPLDIEITPEQVQVYLDEISAAPALRQAWREMRARGAVWKERYTKHARVELLDRRLGGGDAPAAQPVPMGMDIVLDSGLERIHAGDEIRFRVLRHGQPLPGFAVELQGERSPVGLWRRTDAEGRVSLRVPFAGAWLLRGVDLRLSGTRVDSWESDFVTLAFSVAPAPR